MIDSLKDEQDQTSFYKIHIDFSQGYHIYLCTFWLSSTLYTLLICLITSPQISMGTFSKFWFFFCYSGHLKEEGEKPLLIECYF